MRRSAGKRLDKQGAFWSDNEQRMGLDLAVQGMKTDYLAGHGGLSRNMQDLLQDTFQNTRGNTQTCWNRS